MTRDISSLLEAAASRSAEWNGARVALTLAQVQAQIPGALVDWEQDDEGWGRVLSSAGKVYAYVCTRFPVLILDATAGRFGVASPQGVVCLEVSGMDTPGLCGEKHRLEASFGRRLSSNIDYDAFSADDLWWATV